MKRDVGQSGFTLVETLIALAVLSLMMVIAWGTATQTMNAKKHFGAIQDRYREARAAMQRMVGDIEMAYLSGNEDPSHSDPRTFFVGDGSGDIHGLRFSTFAHQRLYADANESDQTVIVYYSAPDRKDRSALNLMRRETRRIFNEKPETLPGESDVLFSNLTKLHFAFFDVKNNEWKDTWNTQGVESGGKRLPDRVRISLSFLDDEGKELTLTTQAKVNLSELIQFAPN